MAEWSIFAWIATSLALIGTVLNCKKIKSCFIFWLVTNLMWFLYDWYAGLYSRMALDAVQWLLAVYGLYEWRKAEKCLKK